jgi:glycosyltransferase involved in cell wall biosynthesis
MAVRHRHLKIAYLIASNDLSGGLRIAIQQARGLADRGHVVTLVCPAPEPDWFELGNARWEAADFRCAAALSDADVRVATFWNTVFSALEDFGGPVFHLCQGYEADFSFYRPIREQIESAYRRPTHKLAVAPHLVDRLTALGYAPVTYVGQAFEPLEFPPAKNRPFNRFPPTVLVAGIFEADVKGVRDALTALADIRHLGVPFRLRRVSTLPLTKAETALIEADEYHLRLTPRRMGEIYRSSDLFIGPSHPEEGFGLPALEALASGLPALLSDTPAHRHIAAEAAEYFPCADIPALASGCAALLSDSSRRVFLSAQGPRQAARFSTSPVVDRLVAVFREVLLK